MPALFPRWANTAARGSLLLIVLLVIGAPVASMVWVRTSFATGAGARVEQPVAFDHRIHSFALHIDCRYCHATVDVAPTAGLPPTVACVGCHNAVWQSSQPFAPVRLSLSSSKPIAWRRVNALPDFVFFDHSIHVAKGVGCETCHGRVDQMAQPIQTVSLSMSWCVACHRDPAPSLRPRSAITTMGWSPPSAERDSLGARLMRENHVRRLTSCSSCHR